jgi:hypothetical protein
MHGTADDPLIARIAAELRRPVPLRPDFDARVMAAVRRAIPSLPVRAWTWLREPRVVAVSPLGGLAMAAGLAGLLVVGTISRKPSAISRQQSAVSRQPSAVSRQQAAVGRQPSAVGAGAAASVTFVLVAPQARSVALAGDFNDWDAARVLMRREASGLWTVDVPLAPGRYRYVFVVDGRRFVADPAAPRAVGDDFGTPTSVVTVGGGALRAAGGSL